MVARRRDRRAGSAAADRAGERALPLSTVATVALPGHGSRFDYADLDAAVYRLFLAHMEDGTLLGAGHPDNKVIDTVPDLPTVTGVIVVPVLHRCSPAPRPAASPTA